MTPPPQRPVFARATVALFVLLYTAFVYFQAATASMNDDFVSGISTLQKLLSPSLLMIIPMTIASTTRQPVWIWILKRTAALTLVAAVLVFLFVLYFDAPGGSVYLTPGERTLMDTVWHSVTERRFSNRSFFPPVWAFIVSGIFWIAAQFMRARRDDPERRVILQ